MYFSSIDSRTLQGVTILNIVKRWQLDRENTIANEMLGKIYLSLCFLSSNPEEENFAYPYSEVREWNTVSNRPGKEVE